MPKFASSCLKPYSPMTNTDGFNIPSEILNGTSLSFMYMAVKYEAVYRFSKGMSWKSCSPISLSFKRTSLVLVVAFVKKNMSLLPDGCFFMYFKA